jgi:hypothetical protein
MYLPDGMTHFNVAGVEYLITANEGDARADYGAANNEETTIGAATYSLDPIAFPYASAMKSNANLGRLKCTNRLGDTDNDGDFDEIYTFGGRSFSIWNATTGTLVYDSGNDLEQITANDPTYGAMFNSSNTNITKKDRSDDKGPEPEGVAVATIAGVPYAFVSMERVGGLMVFNVSNPAAPQFVQYVNNRGLTGLTGDRGPEGIIYVKQQDSPNGKALVVLGNEISSSVSVYEIACPASSATLAAVSSTTACAGNTLTINTSTISGASYAWYNATTLIAGATSATYSATVSGNYSVKLNNVGCTIPSNTVLLTFNALPVVTAASSATVVCEGNNVTLSGGGASTYVWSNGVTDAISFIPTSNTTYTVTGTDANGCSKTATTSVVVNALPVVTAASSATAVCEGNNVTLSGGGASTYVWSNGVTDAISFIPTSNTTNTVTGTDANGCSKTATTDVIVNALPIVTAASSATAVCEGNNVTLSGGGASTYVWSNGVTDAISFIPTSNTTYTVTGTDANGCSKTATTNVIVNALPIVTAASSATAVCAGQTITLTANGATNYTWTNGPNTSTYTVNPLTNATYTVEGLDNNNCFNTSSITISVTANPTVSAIASSTAICAGQTVTLTANGASTYTWLPSGSILANEIVAPTANTTYSLSGISNGCSGNANVQIIVNQLPTISVSTSNSLICVGESVVLMGSSSASTYSWSNGASTMSISVSPTTTTVYSVTVTDGLCNNNSSVTQSVSACTSLNELSSNNSINIYPNPFNESFNLSWDSSLTSGQETQIYVYNALGSLQLQTKTTDTKITISTKDWNSGSYFVKINTKAYKIIKQ